MEKLRPVVSLVLIAFCMLLVGGGCRMTRTVTFPAADECFITSGDGDITKPYTPVGQVLYWEQGFRIPLPFLGLIPFRNVDPDIALNSIMLKKVQSMGGDGIINMRVDWQPAKKGFVGLFANGGHLFVYGTVIKR